MLSLLVEVDSAQRDILVLKQITTKTLMLTILSLQPVGMPPNSNGIVL